MKKLLLTLTLVAAVTVPSFAQISAGIGYANDTKTWAILGENLNTGYNGIYFGAEYNFKFGDVMSVAPGLYLSSLTATYKESLFPGFSWVGKFSEWNISVPVDVRAGFDFSQSVRGLIFAGPTFQIGFSSKFKSTGVDPVNLYDGMGYSPFNIMMGGGIGVEFAEKLRLSVRYDAGLLNRNTSKKDRSKILDRGLHAGISYIF